MVKIFCACRSALTARVAATLPVVAEFPLVVVAQAQGLRAQVTVRGVGSAQYAGGDSDPLAALDRMVLNADVTTPKGIVVVGKGREVTSALIERLLNFARGLGIVEPTEVLSKHGDS